MASMSTFENLDDTVIEDEYDRDEMEEIEINGTESDILFTMDDDRYCYWRDHKAFNDTSAWDVHVPNDDSIPVTFQTDLLFSGQMWRTKEEAKMAVRKYSVENRVEYKVPRSNSEILHCVCKSGANGCKWEVMIRLQKKFGYWCLKTFKGDHVCTRSVILDDNRHLTTKMLGKYYVKVLSEKLRLNPKKIQADVLKDFGYNISYYKAWKTKQDAMNIAFGSWEESFNKLPQLMEIMVERNPGTFVQWDTDTNEKGEVQINRVFWAFGQSIASFQYCRPVICIDGTHLYGKYNGKLLSAIAFDAENRLLPLAFALVESENKSSWKWFLDCIREGVTDVDGLCVISDRHAGIISAMNTLPEWMPPRAFHRVCLRHLKSNFNSKMKNDVMKRELGRLGYLLDQRQFQEQFTNFMNCLEDFPHVKAWLGSIPLDLWTFAYDGGKRWGSMTTNAVECFNNVIKGGRDLPICALVHFIFRQTNKYYVKRSAYHTDHASQFPPKMDQVFADLVDRSKFMR